MPIKTVSVDGVRTSGTATPTSFDATAGVGIIGWNVSATNAGGYFCQPFLLPDDADPSYPIDFYQMIRNNVTLTTTGRVISFRPIISYLNPTQSMAQIVPIIDWLSPDFWPSGDTTEFKLVDDTTPTDPSIPGGTFTQNALIGIRMFRDSLDPADNFPTSIFFPAYLKMVYHKRCQKLCC